MLCRNPPLKAEPMSESELDIRNDPFRTCLKKGRAISKLAFFLCKVPDYAVHHIESSDTPYNILYLDAEGTCIAARRAADPCFIDLDVFTADATYMTPGFRSLPPDPVPPPRPPLPW